MLSPEQIETAGDAVAAVYNDIEAKMLDHLVIALINVEELDQMTMTELNLLAQSHTQQLRDYINDEREVIAAGVRETAERLIEASDADDIRRMGKGNPLWPQQVTATVDGVARILARDNIQMVEGAKQAFLSASVEAITRVNTGTMTTERALHSAVRKLEREGIPIITYQNASTGIVTVANKVDVAVRRHIRTQIAQDGARMTLERMERGEVTLVEVSSHEDSRPSHAAWQGQVYSLHGEVEIDGHKYADFYEATRYGSVDGLLGANCRHSFGPYRHGAPRAYEQNPQHPSGLEGSEVYELEQQQRYLERRIREAKRELRGAQQVYDKTGSLESRTNLLKAQSTLKERQSAMRDLISDANAKAKPGTTVLTRRPNREWAGDMPKGTAIKASGRKVDEFLGGSGASATLKANGITKSAARAAIAKEMASRGGTAADFASLSASDQQGIFKSIVSALRNPAKIKGAQHAAKTAVDRSAPVYAKLEGKHVDKVAKLVGKGTTPAARLYLRYEDQLSLIDHAYRSTAHFSPSDVGVRINVANTYADARRPSMNTWFHEFGHHIDYISTGAQGYAAKRAAGVPYGDMYASTKYKGNAFGKMLKEEATAYVDAVHARIKAEAAAFIDAMDLRGMRDAGVLSEATFSALRHDARAYQRVTSPGFKPEDYGYTPEEVKAIKASKKSIVATVKKDPQYKEAVKKQRAYEAVGKEIRGMTDAQKADLSDIFGGATGNKVDGGWGHRTSYWDKGGGALAREAFAEFYSAHIGNPESLAVLKQYLPKSAEIFEDIIEAIEKGAI